MRLGFGADGLDCTQGDANQYALGENMKNLVLAVVFLMGISSISYSQANSDATTQSTVRYVGAKDTSNLSSTYYYCAQEILLTNADGTTQWQRTGVRETLVFCQQGWRWSAYNFRGALFRTCPSGYELRDDGCVAWNRSSYSYAGWSCLHMLKLNIDGEEIYVTQSSPQYLKYCMTGESRYVVDGGRCWREVEVKDFRDKVYPITGNLSETPAWLPAMDGEQPAEACVH